MIMLYRREDGPTLCKEVTSTDAGQKWLASTTTQGWGEVVWYDFPRPEVSPFITVGTTTILASKEAEYGTALGAFKSGKPFSFPTKDLSLSGNMRTYQHGYVLDLSVHGGCIAILGGDDAYETVFAYGVYAK